MRTRLGELLLVISGLFAGVAGADRGASSTGDERWAETLPERCKIFTQVPADARDAGIAWNQLLSFAACLQDTQVSRVTTADEASELVESMAQSLAPTLALYVDAIERGPGPVQLRAAYHVGMAYVAMVTRARNAIVAPPDLKNERAAAQYRALHAHLEMLLAPVRQATRLTFAVIVEAAKQDSSVAPDEISQNMVAHARAMLALLPEEPPVETVQWTGISYTHE